MSIFQGIADQPDTICEQCGGARRTASGMFYNRSTHTYWCGECIDAYNEASRERHRQAQQAPDAPDDAYGAEARNRLIRGLHGGS